MTLHADNRLADAPMTAIRCRRCTAQFLARKSSWNQTSVQWNADGLAGCVERGDAERMAAHGGRGMFLACSALGESITDAVRYGELPIVDEGPPANT
jgi:hypothetical protein